MSHELTPHAGDILVNGENAYWVDCSCGEFSTYHKAFDKAWISRRDRHWNLARKHWAEATGATPWPELTDDLVYHSLFDHD